MQISRESNQNADFAEESESNELIENGVEGGDGTNVNSKMLSSDSVSRFCIRQITFA